MTLSSPPLVSSLTSLWTTLSLLGTPVVMAGLCLVLVTVLALQRQPRAATACVLIAGGGGALNMTLKAVVHRARPPGSELLLHGVSWSFPSGHAMGSLIGYGLLCYVATQYWSMSRLANALLISAASLLVLLIGVSRIALGVHYRGDVAGGWAIGGIWLVGCLLLLRRIDPPVVRLEESPITQER